MEMSAWSLWDSPRASSELPWKSSQECLAFPSLQTRSLRAPHPEHLPKVGLHRNRQDTGERVGGGKELLRHVKCMSKWGSSGSKLNKPSLGQPQRLQLTGNPSGEVQVLGRKKKSTKFPHPSFSPFLVTIFKA